MQKINKLVSLKLFKLLSFLHNATEGFEIAAEKINDKNIRQSVREVALETNQYKHELNSQMKSLKVKKIKDSDVMNNGIITDETRQNNYNDSTIVTDKEMIQLCCNSEIYFEKAYRNILNEFFPFEELRKMLTYQLNGIKCAFMQLKLLRSVEWR
jgi:hypothetical protein